MTTMRKIILSLVVLLLAAPLWIQGGSTFCAEYWLWADVTTKTMPDGQVITMWGFGLDKDNNFSTGGPGTSDGYTISVPGPVLRVDPADNILTIHLKNRLTEPVSLDIIGQALAVNNGPVWTNFPDDTATWTGARPAGPYYYTARVRSFAHEAAPYGGEAVYVWGTAGKPFKVGSHILQSATNPAKQVQMGLYLAVVKDQDTNLAYAALPGDQGVPYDKELIILFSEIDPEIHTAVANGTYGNVPNATVKSSIHRTPRYSMINGMVWPQTGLDPINMALQLYKNEKLLIRFLNPGLETHVPTISGYTMELWAQGANRFNYPKYLHAFELPPGDAVDALLLPDEAARVPLYDARLDLSNAGGASAGGMMAFIYAGAKIDGEIERYYQTILGRAPLPEGLNYWDGKVWTNSTLCVHPRESYITLAMAIFNSSEYRNKNTTDEAYVTDLYETFYPNYTPTAGDIQGWVDKIQGGMSRNRVLNAFAYSTYFRNYLDGELGQVTTRAECNLVNDFYRGMLGRFPDAGGFRYWRSRMRTAQCGGGDAVKTAARSMAQGFVASREYTLKNTTNERFVEDLYSAILHRAPDTAGYNYWTGLLNVNALTRAQVVNYFINSMEFNNRLAPVVNAGCLP